MHVLWPKYCSPEEMKSLLCCLCFSFLALHAQGDEVPIEKQIVGMIFNRSTAEAYFEKEFAPGSKRMREQGYSEQTLNGARKIIVDSVEGLFSDPAFVSHFANIYGTNFTKTELAEIRDFYATKTGQKMFSFMLTTWNEQRKFPEDLAKKHFGPMTKKLEAYFSEHPREQSKGEQGGADQPATHSESQSKGSEKLKRESEGRSP